MPPDDQDRRVHMIEAGETVLRFMAGRSRTDLDQDEMLRFAVVRAIEIIGEAASKITPTTRAAYADLPWPAIIGMRNRLVHAYFDIDTRYPLGGGYPGSAGTAQSTQVTPGLVRRKGLWPSPTTNASARGWSY